MGEAPQTWLAWIAHWLGGITTSTWACHILTSQYLHQPTGTLLSAWREHQLHGPQMKRRSGLTLASALWWGWCECQRSAITGPRIQHFATVPLQRRLAGRDLKKSRDTSTLWITDPFRPEATQATIASKGWNLWWMHWRGDFWQFINLDPISLLMRQRYPSRVVHRYVIHNYLCCGLAMRTPNVKRHWPMKFTSMLFENTIINFIGQLPTYICVESSQQIMAQQLV